MDLARAHEENRAIINLVGSEIYLMLTRPFFQSQDQKEIVPVKIVIQVFSGKRIPKVTNAEVFRTIGPMLSRLDFPDRDVFHGIVGTVILFEFRWFDSAI